MVQVAGEVEVVVRGDVSQLDRDLQRAQGSARNFDRQMSGASRGVVQSTRAMSSASRTATAANDNLAGSFRGAAQSIGVLHGPLGGIASRFSSFGMLARGVGAAVAAAATAITAFGFASRNAVSAFTEFERQQFTIQQVIRATGGAAGRTADDIERLSREIGFGTLANTAQVRQAAQQLLTFRTISEEVFDTTLRLAQDLAAAGFGTVTSAAMQLAKALEDPATGLTMLRRVGISFTQSQRDMIKELTETGRQLEAQHLMLGRITQQVGGAGTEAGKGLAGAWDTLSEATGRWLELAGKQIVALTGMDRLIRSIGEGMKRGLERLEAGPADLLQELTTRRLIAQTQLDSAQHPERRRRLQAAINLMIQEELVLQREVTGWLDRQREAAERAAEVRDDIKQENIEAVESEIRNRIELIGLTAKQLELRKALRAAGVEAGTAEAAGIERLIDLEFARRAALEATGEVVKKVSGLTEEAKQRLRSLEDTAFAVTDAMSRAFSDFVETGKFSFREMVNSMLQDLARLAFRQNVAVPLQKSIVEMLVGSAVDPWAATVTPAFQGGGAVRGPGTGTSDSIPAVITDRSGRLRSPARISDGEFIVNARATERHRGLLEAVNRGDIDRFARGGIVDRPALFPTARGPGGRLGAEGAGGERSISVRVENRIINEAPSTVQVHQRRGPDGSMELVIRQVEDAMVESMVAGRLGHASDARGGRWGR